jgi:Lrp/AsnC family transcriptional regulator for asnA, asnC and gidA
MRIYWAKIVKIPETRAPLIQIEIKMSFYSILFRIIINFDKNIKSFSNMGHHQIDKLDEKILQLISQNARIPFLEVARECNVSGAAIHQRIQKLTNLGIIKGSEFILDAEKIGYETCAYIGIFLKEAKEFKNVVESLKTIPEVVECHYTTGKYAMFIKIYAKNNTHLLDVIHNKFQRITGIASTETLISFSEAFKRQVPLNDLDVEDNSTNEE